MQTVYLSEYQKDWPLKFEAYKTQIDAAFKGVLNLHIEHVGSTSVVGLMAKPLIDIQIGIEHEKELDELIKPMQKLGFIYNSTWSDELPFRRLFQHLVPKDGVDIPLEVSNSDKEDLRIKFEVLANIHCVPIDSEWWVRHLKFRNILRTNTQAFKLYQNTKIDLAKQKWLTIADYAEAKNEVIAEIIKMA